MLNYEKYNKKSLLVHGNREKYGDKLKEIGGRWNNRVKGEPGWTVPLEKENLLKKLIKNIEKEETIRKIGNNAKPASEHRKYHRAVSEEDTDVSEEDYTDGENNIQKENNSFKFSPKRNEISSKIVGNFNENSHDIWKKSSERKKYNKSQERKHNYSPNLSDYSSEENSPEEDFPHPESPAPKLNKKELDKQISNKLERLEKEVQSLKMEQYNRNYKERGSYEEHRGRGTRREPRGRDYEEYREKNYEERRGRSSRERGDYEERRGRDTKREPRERGYEERRERGYREERNRRDYEERRGRDPRREPRERSYENSRK